MRNPSAEAREAKGHERVGEFLASLARGRGCRDLEKGQLVGLTIRLPTTLKPEVLIVLRGVAAGKAFVAFVGGLDLTQALLLWRAKESSEGVKWRLDIPWGERDSTPTG